MTRTLSRALALTLLTIFLGALDAPRAWAVPNSPMPVSPANAFRLQNWDIQLEWRYPSEPITQVRLEMLPANGDGAGIDVILNANPSVNGTFRVPAPPEWYGLLPDMTYRWRLQASEATTSITLTDPSWGPWSPTFSFQTPRTRIQDLSPLTPNNGATTITTPQFTWRSTDPQVFYYEFQLSSDPTFNTDPATATASVYWNLIHGAIPNPKNSYTVPPSAALQKSTTYYWRVRPRIQGDGTPMPWTEPWFVRVP